MYTKQSKKLSSSTLSADQIECILAKFGLSDYPEADENGLQALYHAWCRKVPFDNTLWRLYLASDCSGAMPGETAKDFFDSWLKFGTGGICYPSAGALHALLTHLGFNVCPILSWMPDLMHSSLAVECDGTTYYVDQAVPHSEPIALDQAAKTEPSSPGWGMRVFFESARWHYRWMAFRQPEVQEMGCVFAPWQYSKPMGRETLEQNLELYSRKKEWSPYNYNINARLFKGDFLMRVVEGKKEVIIDRSGQIIQRALTRNEVLEVLVDAFGISEEIVRQLPECGPSIDRRRAETDRRSGADRRNQQPEPINLANDQRKPSDRRQGPRDRRRKGL
jgi:N-hydroxyarylamine O-acetyltransferase